MLTLARVDHACSDAVKIALGDRENKLFGPHEGATTGLASYTSQDYLLPAELESDAETIIAEIKGLYAQLDAVNSSNNSADPDTETITADDQEVPRKKSYFHFNY